MFAIAVVVAACAGDEPPASGKCTGAVYDPCIEEHDCLSLVCQNFAEFQVCSQACDDATPCPDNAACDTGFCKPTAPNDCEQ